MGRGVVAALTTALGVMGSAIGAQAAEECKGFLPDFGCDREARPAGHVAPMSMPYLFEDPYITTELNLVGIYHNFPSDSVFNGGEAGVLALQGRLALTDRLAFIATKDGYMVNRPDHPWLKNENGFMDITAGFKYALIDDRARGLIVTPSLRVEIPVGNRDVFQGDGKGVFIPGISVGWGPKNVHLITDIGAQLPVDHNRDSTSVYYNIHLDQAFEVSFIPGADYIVPFIELNGMVWVDSGSGSAKVDLKSPPAPAQHVSLKAAQNILHAAGVTRYRRFEGADVANLGSSGMAGEDLVTFAWGVRVPLRNRISMGFSYERALSQRKDIFEQRATWMIDYQF
ncbi:MAG: hypothetical protein U0900_10450 [Myxococcota bacterium]